MRSLQFKFSGLVISLLLMASVSLAWIATEHERGALEEEVEKRGRAVAKHLAGAAKEPLLSLEHGDFEPELTLEQLIEDVGAGEGVIAARLLDREGRIAASLAPAERDSVVPLRATPSDDSDEPLSVTRSQSRLLVAVPVKE